MLIELQPVYQPIRPDLFLMIEDECGAASQDPKLMGGSFFRIGEVIEFVLDVEEALIKSSDFAAVLIVFH
jgi:hypothetical protein